MGLATAAIIGGAIAVGSGIAGANEANKSRRAAAAAAGDKNAMIAELKEQMPDISDLELQLLVPQLVGEYDPENMTSLNLDPSAMEDVSADEQLKLEQLKALTGISEIADGGLTEADKAASRDIQREVNQNNQARKESILMEMAQRGTLGSGAELAAMLDSNQQAADAQAAASDNLIQQAQARSLQALMQQGNMAGNMRNQDFGEQSQVAQARDAINQFNTQNAQQVMNQNVTNRNQAQQMNLANKQAIANAGAQIKNQEQMHNKNLLNEKYNREADLVKARMGIRSDLAAQEQQAHRDTAAGIAQAGGGLMNMFGSGGK